MFFLTAQMWIWMLLAALAGGLIGWALRCRRCAREMEALISQRDTAVAEAKTLRAGGAIVGASVDKVADLEAQISAERDEVAGLKAKLAAATAGGVGMASSAVAATSDEQQEVEDEGALQWRNRYLESRVRFLESKLAEMEKNGIGAQSGTASSLEDADGDINIARLKWRNRYLEGRVRYLEEDAAFSTMSDNKTTPEHLSSAASIAAIAPSGATEVAQKDEPKPQTATTAKPPKKKKAKTTKKPAKKDSPTTISVIGLSAAEFLTAMEGAEGYESGDNFGKPPTLKAPIGGAADNLREIAGVGPKLEKLLHELGFYHFAQIANWSEDQVNWVDERLTFKGRIRRENWIDQCKDLAQGVETDGQRKYKEGKHS